MLPIILCILFNVILFVIFKYFDRFSISRFPAIVANYLVCFLLGSTLCLEELKSYTSAPPSWILHTALLGALLILGFNLISKSVTEIGMATTSMAQRLSLLASVFFGILYFRESADLRIYIAIALGIVSIILITSNPLKKTMPVALQTTSSTLPLFVFLISAGIEIMILYLSKSGKTQEGDYGATTMTFGIAFLLGSAIWLFRRLTFSIKDVIAGVILGVPNFFSIHFLFQSFHQPIKSSIIIPVINLGILLLATLVGFLVFNEPRSTKKLVGLGLACFSILFLIF